MDPELRKISEKFRNDHEAFKDAWARAWFKLTHRDMGPKVRYLGPEVPAEDLIWQDPVPHGTMPSDADVAAFKAKILGAGFSVGAAGQDGLGVGLDLSPLRPSRRRQRRAHSACAAEGLGGQRARRAGRVLAKIDELRGSLSMADAIVLAGTAAVEKAARDAGFNVAVPFTGGRGDATQEWTDVESFAVAGAGGRRLPQLPQDQAFGADRGAAARPRPAARPVGAGDDGAARRPARARRQLPGRGRKACSPAARAS